MTDAYLQHAAPSAADQADDDRQLIRLWLHGKSANTREAYLRDLAQFTEHAALGLREVKLRHLQDWLDALSAEGCTPATRARKLAALKSLFTFGHRIGYFAFNVGAAVRTPRVPDLLARRILTEEALGALLAAPEGLRNSVLLRLFYNSGARVSELAGLTWRALAARSGAGSAATGQVTLLGKGEKTRNVILQAPVWAALNALRQRERAEGYGGPEDAVFRSKKGGRLSRQQIWRIIGQAARMAGLPEGVSPHWLRHAHASHALDHGAPVHLVQQTLGHKSMATTSRYSHARPDDSSANYLNLPPERLAPGV